MRSETEPIRAVFRRKSQERCELGFMQGDLAAGSAIVTHTFHDVLEGSGIFLRSQSIP